MRRRSLAAFGIAGALLLGGGMAGWLCGSPGREAARHDSARDANAPFAALRSLEGDWTGTLRAGSARFDATVRYRVISAGHAIQESVFPGDENEVLTVYYLSGDDVRMDHFCALGNRPQMACLGVDHGADGAPELRFGCAPDDPLQDEVHMHAGVITFLDPDHFVAKWSLWAAGRPVEEREFRWSRAR